MASQLNTASCFESNSSSTSADLKQPLIVVHDLESSSSSQEEQTIDSTRQKLGILVVLLKSLCLGAFVGLLIQTITFSAFLLITKKWAKIPSRWTQYVLVYIDIAIFSIISWGSYCMAGTRNKSMYMRKKFDNDADGAPNTESVWTKRYLLVSGIAFLHGFLIGSFIAWVIVDIKSGLPVPAVSLLFIILVHVGLCCLLVKCFAGHGLTAAYDEEEPEDDDKARTRLVLRINWLYHMEWLRPDIVIRTCSSIGLLASNSLLQEAYVYHVM